MKIDGSYTAHSPRGRVFELLVNEEVLRRCVPGCRRLVREGEDQFSAVLDVGLGSVQGTYEGTVALNEKAAPERLVMTVDGKGKLGFVRGKGSIRLEAPAENAPRLTHIVYEGDLQVGGAIAGVGQRVVQAAAKMMAGQFFAAIDAEAKAAESEALTPVKHGGLRNFFRWLRSILRSLLSHRFGKPL